jgi:hypothetical protein
MLWVVSSLMAVLLVVGPFGPDASGQAASSLFAGQGTGALIAAGFVVFGVGCGCLYVARGFERGV